MKAFQKIIGGTVIVSVITLGILALNRDPEPVTAATFGSGPNLQWPVTITEPWKSVNSVFGPRLLNESYDFHRGIDIVVPVDQSKDVVVAASGTVFRMYKETDANSPYPGSGNTLILKHTLKPAMQFHNQSVTVYYTLYQHVAGFASNLKEGDPVLAGQVIATIGSSSASYEHLHFEVRLGTTYTLESQIRNLSNTSSFKGFDPHVNPLTYLPYPEMNVGSAALTQLVNNQIALSMTSPHDRTDVNQIDFYAYAQDQPANVVASKTIDFNNRVGVDATSTVALDNPTSNGITIQPGLYSTNTPETNYSFTVDGLIGPNVGEIVVLVRDVRGRILTTQTLDNIVY